MNPIYGAIILHGSLNAFSKTIMAKILVKGKMMQTFEIKEDFLLNGQPIKIISGAIHYFRMTPSQWEDSLYNLKALGANTVETYIPWNIHEPEEGVYDFEGMKNIEAFVRLAEKLNLLVILRPSAYICAEWEFGGLPAWLLKEKVCDYVRQILFL